MRTRGSRRDTGVDAQVLHLVSQHVDGLFEVANNSLQQAVVSYI